MGSSFIEYRGYGFWSADTYIERLVREAADTIAEMTKEDWEADLAAHWNRMASGGFGGWVHLYLDELLIDDRRRSQIQGVIQRVTELHADDDPIHQTGILLLKLLDGKLKTDAASPLDYMVGS